MNNIRNIAIIAHVDHGKTTLVDGLLKQSKTFRDNQAEMSQNLIMDSNDQERERGITILAKNTAIKYNGVKINIIDTPGHADFGGEVERTLNMADGVILVVDAQEGPMPQTKFVLKKALELNLKVIVVINKIDKKNAQIPTVINKISDLFLDLATDDSQLDFPTYFTIARDGKAWDKIPNDFSQDSDLTCIFEAIITHIPKPKIQESEEFKMLVSALDYDNFQGKYAIGKIHSGIAKPNTEIKIINCNGIKEKSKIEKIFVSSGLKKLEVKEVQAGDIVALTGIKNIEIGDTISQEKLPTTLKGIEISKPTLKMAISANTSPFSGCEGQFVTGRQILDRIKKELETNVSMKLDIEDGEYIISGRGELHLSVFIETLRREGFEMQIGKPQVITKEIDGILCEPIEELTIEIPNEYINTIITEVIKRKGNIISQEEQNVPNGVRLVFEIITRGILGLRSKILTLSCGNAVTNSVFLKYEPIIKNVLKMRNGVLISSENGKAVTYGLNNAQARGITFIEPQTEVYQGMIVGLHSRENDLDINVAKEKKLTNIRSSTSDISVILTPATKLSLEQSIEFLEEDELLEVTPNNLRLRKKILDPLQRRRTKIKFTV